MEPFAFTPWAWRDPAWLIGRDTAFDRARESAGDGESRDTDLVGYHVEATDGGIGKVDGDNGRTPDGCLLIDTGPWIFGRTVVLPVGIVRHVDHDERTIHVDRTKDQIKAAPEYDPDSFDSDEFRHRTDAYYAESYRLLPPML
ncbi:PRC-barrel domain containing protein [Actinosynnema sp. NPDC023587]|uniref:PRC-barrel domain containing protein n=1 Tax=Actinosynnema sp. NPDC023587 TaxID=3154695 RepID=UPI0033DE4C0B